MINPQKQGYGMVKEIGKLCGNCLYILGGVRDAS
jgi:hypothetical protein